MTGPRDRDDFEPGDFEDEVGDYHDRVEESEEEQRRDRERGYDPEAPYEAAWNAVL